MPDVSVVALVTSFNNSADRVAMHAVRRSLVHAQAARVGLPLWSVELPSPCSNAQYEELMTTIWQRAVTEQISEVAFGDLFLQDIRDYRERQLNGTGLTPLFPIWNIPTRGLAHEMLRTGVKAKLTCVDPSKLDQSFAGRDFSAELLESLPASVDPCGENGEFHTLVYDSPVFSSAIPVVTGEVVERDGFIFSDVLPQNLADQPLSERASRIGLCASCKNAKVITSDRKSVFYRCMVSDQDPNFARYPRLPVLACSAFSAM
jgi:uncharacterized protein (TIGR00290 family)